MQTFESRPDDARLVFVTAPDEAVARRLADGLVAARLAACVNILPGLRSVYHWEGEVHSATEVLLLAKTTAERVPEIESFLDEHHPYDCPECVALATASVEAAYLAWLRAGVAR